MSSALSRLVAGACFVFAGSAWAADVGRVLLAAGDAVAVRGNQTIRLALGTAVQEKDLLRTGAASNLQVRFVDESIVSLRESTEFRIDEFRYAGKEDGSERAFFRLLKGGLRTVTGLVGRSNNKNYALSAVTSTIGIRGTDFSVRACQQDCFKADGSREKDGIFGSVHGASHGSNTIDVRNPAAQGSFGIGQHFFDDGQVVQRLLAQPEVVANRLEGRGKSTARPAGTGGEQTTTGGAGRDSRAREAPPPPLLLQFIVTESRAAGGGLSLLSPTTAFVVSFQDAVDGALVAGGGQFIRAVNASGLEVLTGFNNVPVCDNTCGTASGLTVPAAVTDVGFGPSVNAHWGRWTNGVIREIDGTLVQVGAPGVGHFHYLYADLTPFDVIAAKSGSFSFVHVNGTSPTDQNGNVASGSSFGPVNVNFSSRTLNFSSMSWTIAGVTHSFSGVPGILRPNQSPPAGAVMVFDAAKTSATGCSGGACSTGGPATVNITGSFAGRTGNHLGGGFATTSAAGTTNSVQMFTCPTCP